MGFVTLRVDLDMNKLRADILSVLTPEVMTQMYLELYSACDPYVPYVTGALANNVAIDSNGIHYLQSYAEDVYNSNRYHSPSVHPLASSYWDEAMYRDHKDEFDKKLTDIVNKGTKRV